MKLLHPQATERWLCPRGRQDFVLALTTSELAFNYVFRCAVEASAVVNLEVLLVRKLPKNITQMCLLQYSEVRVASHGPL